MDKKSMQYIEKNTDNQIRLLKTEMLFTPLLVFLPFIVGVIFILDWFNRGFIPGDPRFNGELVIGFIIIIGNLFFDIPFIKSLKKFSQHKK